MEEKNTAFVLEAFDTLFNTRGDGAAERYWSPNDIQRSTHIAPSRDGLGGSTTGCVRTHATWFLAEQSVDFPPQKEEKHALPPLCVNQDQSAPRSHGMRLPPLSLS
jgi:hypothetical protein